MKTIITIATLIVIVSVSVFSAHLYLNQHYNISALLTVTWIISLAAWIKANGLLEDKKMPSVN
jgi:Na+/proline symporter